MASLKNHHKAGPSSTVILSLALCAAAGAVEFAGGTGEPNDPYQIATAEQLIGLGRDPNLYDRHFVLVADIDLPQNPPAGRLVTKEAVAVIAPGPVEPYGEGGGRFTGRFDGNHHAVRNLRIHAIKGSGLGLFGYIGVGGRVENLRLENADIIGNSTLGLLAASNGGTISNCTVTGFVRGQRDVGGLVGANGLPGKSRGPSPLWQPGQIEHCGSACTVEGGYSVGGLVGANLRGTITCSWADCTIDGDGDVGGLVGTTWSDEISSCYALGHIAGKSDVGGLIGTNMHSVVWACYAHAEVRGERVVAGLVAANEGGTIYCCYSAGQVSGEQHPAGLVSTNNSGVVHLCYWDLEAAGTAYSAKGKGRTTSQMRSAATFDGWGFLGQWTVDEQNDFPRLAWQGLPGESIKDAQHSYSGDTGEPDSPYRIETPEDLATVSRYAGDWGKHFLVVRDIELTDTDITGLTPIGFSDVPFTGVFDGNDRVISGLRYDLPDEDYVGLFRHVGRPGVDANASNGVIRHLHLKQVEMGGHDWVAGLAGLNRGLIESCSISGSLASQRNTGGLVAENFGVITHCRANVSVLRSQTSATGLGDVGGLVAWNEGSIRNCFTSGRVDGASGAQDTGGLIGSSYGGMIENSWASTDVNGFRDAGGLAGSVSGTEITCCCSWGRVTSSEPGGCAGGLVGAMYGLLRSSYATGSVSGNGYVGALVGQNGGTIASCYATGKVAGSGTLGGLVADDFLGTAYLSYWDRQATGVDASEGGTPQSTEQMMRAATFVEAGWDFADTWMICEGKDYPRLRWEQVTCE